MKPTRIRVILTGFFTVLFSIAVPVVAVQFFPLDNLRPGMTGYGRTVIQGNQVQNFDVEVLGALEYQGAVDQLVLVRVGGDLMERSGGIAQGMSGSPVYLDGQLLGALSYGYGFADHFIGMVTPIQAMLPILDLVPSREMQLSHPLELDGQRYTAVSLGSSDQPGVLELQPVATQIMVSGMGARGIDRLQEAFKGYNVNVRSVGAVNSDFSPAPLEPGSPVAVDLIKGDIRASALGTITYLDESGRFLAFGHPFASRGESNYFASYAQVLTTVSSIDTPFKIGKPGPSFGWVSQDRQAGIGGQIGIFPSTIPVRINVRDLNLQRDGDFSFETIKDPVLSLNLIDSAALQTIDTTLDRIGAGTASVEFTISGSELPAGGFTRKNLFFSSFDVAAISLGELYEALDMLFHNEFKETDISNIDISILVEKARRTAKIEKARLLADTVFPGDTVEVEVTLRPWRSNPITRVIKMEVPLGTKAGEVTVTVRNGSYLGYSGEEEQVTEHADETDEPGKPDHPAEIKGKKSDSGMKSNAESLELLISDFILREKNNEIIAEFYPPIGYSQEEEGFEGEVDAIPAASDTENEPLETEDPYALDEELNSKSITASLETEYVVEGSTTVQMIISSYSELEDGVPVDTWSGKRISLDN